MLYLLAAIFCMSSINLGFTAAKHQTLDNLHVSLFNYISASILGFFFLIRADLSFFPPSFSHLSDNLFGTLTPQGSMLFSILFGLLTGCAYLWSLLITQKSIGENGPGITTMFQRLGIIIPIVCSILLWGERPSLTQILGIGVALLSMVVLQGKQKSTSILSLLLVFLAGGVVELTNKLFQKCSLADYKPLFLFVIFFTCVPLTFLYMKRQPSKPILGREVLLGLGIGIPNFLSPFFIILSLEAFPSSIVFPVLSVGAILFVSICSAVLFHEKLTKNNYFAFGLILISLVLINL